MRLIRVANRKPAAPSKATRPNVGIPHTHAVLVIDNSPVLTQRTAAFAELYFPRARTIMADSLNMALHALKAGTVPCLVVLGGQFSVQQVHQFLAAKAHTPQASVPVAWLSKERIFHADGGEYARFSTLLGGNLSVSAYCSL